MEAVIVVLSVLLSLESVYLVVRTRPRGVEGTLRAAAALIQGVSAEAASRDFNTRRVSKIVSDINNLVTESEQN